MRERQERETREREKRGDDVENEGKRHEKNRI